MKGFSTRVATPVSASNECKPRGSGCAAKREGQRTGKKQTNKSIEGREAKEKTKHSLFSANGNAPRCKRVQKTRARSVTTQAPRRRTEFDLSPGCPRPLSRKCIFLRSLCSEAFSKWELETSKKIDASHEAEKMNWKIAFASKTICNGRRRWRNEQGENRR